MKNQIIAAAAALSSLAFAGVASAAPAYYNSVEQLIVEGSVGQFSAQPFVQSFTAAADNVAGLSINMYGDGVELVTLSLYDDLPTAIGATALASGSVTALIGWNDVSFAATGVTPGGTYYLVATAAGLGSASVLGATANPYTGGQVWVGPELYSLPGLDLAFKVVSDDDFALTSDVPLPAAAPLALLGFGALAVAGRRRKA